MNNVPGTQGYAEVASAFTRVCESINFYSIHGCIVDLIPGLSSRILDVGAGTGRDAAALAEMGHNVVAVEPTTEFINTAKEIHRSHTIQWVSDSLPYLESLGSRPFDFILCHAVWQHLDAQQRVKALSRIFELLLPGGVFALSLRHGPPGAGVHYFPSDWGETLTTATTIGFTVLRKLENQPSFIPGKADVKWTRLVFTKSKIRNHRIGA